MQCRKAALERVLALLILAVLVVDIIGGCTPLWANERVRVLVSRIRLPLDAVVLTVYFVAATRQSRRNAYCFASIALVLLAMVTTGGIVVACIEQVKHPSSHEWIFAVESAGVLVLLAAWTCTYHRCSDHDPMTTPVLPYER